MFMCIHLSVYVYIHISVSTHIYICGPVFRVPFEVQVALSSGSSYKFGYPELLGHLGVFQKLKTFFGSLCHKDHNHSGPYTILGLITVGYGSLQKNRIPMLGSLYEETYYFWFHSQSS